MPHAFGRSLQLLTTLASLLPGVALANPSSQEEPAEAREQDFGTLAYNPLDDTTFFVNQVYLDLLNRYPSSWDLYVAQGYLNGCNGDASCLIQRRIDVARSIFESPEHYTAQGLNPYDPSFQATYVTRCYTGFMRRSPDASGYAFWLTAIQTSGDYAGLIRGFIDSSEYRSRFGAP